MKKYRMVLVEWRDAIVRAGWEHTDEALSETDEMACTTIGYLIEKTKEHIVVAGTLSDDGAQLNGRITIPMVWVVKIQTLKV